MENTAFYQFLVLQKSTNDDSIPMTGPAGRWKLRQDNERI